MVLSSTCGRIFYLSLLHSVRKVETAVPFLHLFFELLKTVQECGHACGKDNHYNYV